MLDHDFTYFGCGNKLSAKDLISKGFVKNVASLSNDSESFFPLADEMRVSVDTLMPFTSDIKLYVDASYLHCANDLYSAGAMPRYSTASIGLSPLLTESEKCLLVNLLSERFEREGVRCLKYHTYYSDQTTLTITLFGNVENNYSNEAQEGMTIILTKPIVMHNKSVQFPELCHQNMSMSNKDIAALVNAEGVLCKDISGFGLIGSIIPMLYHGNLYANINIDLIKIDEGEFENGQDCSSRHNLESFNDYIFEMNALSHLEKNIISIGQTNGPMVLLTQEPDYHIGKLESMGYQCAAIGKTFKRTMVHDHIVYCNTGEL